MVAFAFIVTVRSELELLRRTFVNSLLHIAKWLHLDRDTVHSPWLPVNFPNGDIMSICDVRDASTMRLDTGAAVRKGTVSDMYSEAYNFAKVLDGDLTLAHLERPEGKVST